MNLMEMMKQAKGIQKKIEEAQKRAGEVEAEGISGGGMVRITLNGNKEMKRVTIDPSLANPSEMEVLEDLIIAAFNEAKAKAEEAVAKEMESVTEGIPLPPGIKLPF